MEGCSSNSDGKQTDRKRSVKRRAGGRWGMDPNMPELPPFPRDDFLSFFSENKEELKKQLRENHTPPMRFDGFDLFSAAREKWDNMSDADKAPYLVMAEKNEKEYEKSMEEFRKSMTAYHEKRAATEKADRILREEACRNLAGLTTQQ